MKVGIRADSNVSIGTGHIMRCGVLAQKFKKAGAEVTFFCHQVGSAQRKLIEDSWGSKLTMLRAPESELPDSCDLLIVDHYALEEAWEKLARAGCSTVMVIDDLANRRHDCDLLLDQNYFPGADRYQKWISKTAVRLCGPQYALLREEFALCHELAHRPARDLHKILIFMGGTDPHNDCAKVSLALEEMALPEVEILIFTSSSNPYLKELRKSVEARHQQQMLVDTENMAELMRDVDLAIASGGSSTWERLCLGIPSITMSVAENQERLSESLAVAGYILYLGQSNRVNRSQIQGAVRELTSIESRQQLKDRAFGLVDGNGAERVVGEIFKMVSYLK